MVYRPVVKMNADLIGGRRCMDPCLGHVRGRVVDLDGRGILNGRVWIRETGRSTYTDESGNFVLVNVPPAVYSLVAESEGYAQAVITDVPVEIGDNPGNLFVMYPQYSRSRFDHRHCEPLFQNC